MRSEKNFGSGEERRNHEKIRFLSIEVHNLLSGDHIDLWNCTVVPLSSKRKQSGRLCREDRNNL